MSTILTRLEELQQAAGSRGYTFAGRHVQSSEESLAEILRRLPVAELESAGFQRTAGFLNAGSPRATIMRYAKPLREIGKLPQDEESKAQARANLTEEIAPLTDFLRRLRGSPLAGIINLFDQRK